MKYGTFLALFVALGLLAACAQAGEQPVLQCAHDTDITYRIQHDGAMTTERVRWLASRQIQRIDPPQGGLYMLINRADMHIALVDPLRHGVLDIEASDPRPQVVGKSKMPEIEPLSGAATPEMQYEKAGSRVVDGLPCTEWVVTADGKTATPKTAPAAMCMTSDGMLLQVRIGEQIVAQAVSVSAEKLDADLFKIPASYAHTTPEALKAAP
ncbi:hypothetical protein [Granulibacter bethesdensis]|uniref:hypothetical protein n=1 Tax=Granulibacter bethesdensis TaxID=364410 RepID=UPI0003F1D4F8|nr:hypothetical protein [Granulibacter bethesdensis]AHJ65581.1 putative secreted protein [Granulibacter bethesdensis CGDNIH4]